MTISVKPLICAMACVCFCGSAWASPFQETGSKKQDEKKTEEKAKDGSKKPAPVVFDTGDGRLEFTASGTWKEVAPKSNMLDAEFKIPRTGDDAADGRLTFMNAGGSIQANIDRWMGQFSGPIESQTSETTVSGQKIHWVDIKGDYTGGMGGRFAAKKKMEKYRMLAAIVETEKYGLHFIKLTGPQATLKANKKKFDAMVKSLKMLD